MKETKFQTETWPARECHTPIFVYIRLCGGGRCADHHGDESKGDHGNLSESSCVLVPAQTLHVSDFPCKPQHLQQESAGFQNSTGWCSFDALITVEVMKFTVNGEEQDTEGFEIRWRKMSLPRPLNLNPGFSHVFLSSCLS